jgi:hypothetical protein
MAADNSTKNDQTEVDLSADAGRLITECNEDSFSESEYTSYLESMARLYASGQLTSLVPALPLLLRLKGRPYSLVNHFPMEPLFDTHLPRQLVVKAGRQISKTTSLAAQGVIQSTTLPYFSTLFVCPRFEQTRRFSNNYVRPFLIESPVGRLSLDFSKEQSVLQRSYRNGSVQHFSFAFLDCNRTRGIAASALSIDEIQDIDPDFIPIMSETLSASEYGLRQYTGTPKTFDNTLQELWEDSSQAEWVIPCGCSNPRYWNIATVDCDLLNMIQQHGLSCAKCGKLIDARQGHWEHRYSEKIHEFPGFHTPQPIMPMHYEPDPKTGVKEKWKILWDAKNNMAKGPLFNEKLGESCDVRSNLLTKPDLQKASNLKMGGKLHVNDLDRAVKLVPHYIERTMGVDWGGGGLEGVSYTTIVILGHKPNGDIDVLYGERLVDFTDPAEEVAIILHYLRAFRCGILAHDFAGSGSVKETLLLQAGLPINKLFPAFYMRAYAGPMVNYKPPKEGIGGRAYYVVDKARSLVLLCELIKHDVFHFPKWESWEHLATDFLALVEDKHEMTRGADIYLVGKKKRRSDDFAHSVNYASLAYWHSQQRYPDLAKKIGVRLTSRQQKELQPSLPRPRLASDE